MRAAYTLGLDPDGREHAVVVVKGTFMMPPRGGVAQLHDQQMPFTYAETFTGEPGLSAVEYESDFAPTKPMCDVLLLGQAYAPHGRPARAVPVAVRVGRMTKGFEVVGKRHWTAGVAGGVAPSRPEPFTTLPISYDRAFGGTEPSNQDPSLVNAYDPNPVGVGFFKDTRRSGVLGQPAPNTQERGASVTSTHGKYRPMSFGPLGRNFEERMRYAGSYDARWLDDVFPFLPADFDSRYYQAAPADQQMPYPSGGENVQLLNLTPTPIAPFQLPRLELPVEFSRVGESKPISVALVVDTILLEPEHMQMQLVWRTSLALREDIREVSQAVIGRMPPGWYRARQAGKVFVPMSQLHELGKGR